MNKVPIGPHRRADAHRQPVRFRDLGAAPVIQIARALDADLDHIEAHASHVRRKPREFVRRHRRGPDPRVHTYLRHCSSFERTELTTPERTKFTTKERSKRRRTEKSILSRPTSRSVR